LVQRLRADRPGLKVVYMSGYAGSELLGEPMSRLVRKPFNLLSLERIVREQLDRPPYEARRHTPAPPRRSALRSS
jgi:hypothetical protein